MDSMIPFGGILIKNEPIKTEDIEFVPDEEFLKQNVVIKAERGVSPNEIYSVGCQTRTIVCSESEYLAKGNAPFESIIVKEEPRLNIYDDITAMDRNSAVISDVLIEKVFKNFECYICRFVVDREVTLRAHMNSHTLFAQFDRKFPKKQSHRIGERSACDQCDRTFTNRMGLKRHKLIHTERQLFACDQCDRKCVNKSSLKLHKLIHSGIKPFVCDECDRKFSHSSTLYKHKKIHTGVRPFVCHLCDKRCSRKSTLDRHLKTHIGERSFVCDICDKRFSRNSTLNHHKLLHSGHRFECDLCDRKFVIKSSLFYHLQTHGEKRFSCDECDRKFSTKANLNQHKKTHVPVKSFHCDKCFKIYFDKSALSRHIADHDDKSVNVGDKIDKTRRNKKQSKYTTLMNKCKSLRKI